MLVAQHPRCFMYNSKNRPRLCLYLRRELNPYSPYGKQDFKSCASTSSATKVFLLKELYDFCFYVSIAFCFTKIDNFFETTKLFSDIFFASMLFLVFYLLVLYDKDSIKF